MTILHLHSYEIMTKVGMYSLMFILGMPSFIAILWISGTVDRIERTENEVHKIYTILDPDKVNTQIEILSPNH